MVRLGNRIRLASKELERLTIITGFTPGEVKTIDELDAYIERCKRYYWGESEDTRLLHWLIDRERFRILGFSPFR